MSTTLVKPAEVERKWYLLDAAGKSLGHIAGSEHTGDFRTRSTCFCNNVAYFVCADVSSSGLSQGGL